MHTPISRRAALKASGIAIALPLLESMNPAMGREVATAPKRMILICTTLGLHPPSLFPGKPGGEYESTEYLDLLNDHRDDFTLFSGLSHPDQTWATPTHTTPAIFRSCWRAEDTGTGVMSLTTLRTTRRCATCSSTCSITWALKQSRSPPAREA